MQMKTLNPLIFGVMVLTALVNSQSYARADEGGTPTPAASSQPASKNATPDFLKKAGFYAILGSIQDQNFIFIESRDDGLLFRVCEAGASDDVLAGDKMPTNCPLMLNNDTIAIPPDLLLNNSLGIKRILLTGLKVAASGAVIGLTNVSFGYLTSAAAMVNSVFPPNPVQEIMDYKQAKDVINQMLRFGQLSDKKQDGYIVTELLDAQYDDIKSGVIQELMSIVHTMLKNDKTLDMRWKLAYHSLMNQRFAALHKKGTDAVPATQPSSEPSAQPAPAAATPAAAEETQTSYVKLN